MPQGHPRELTDEERLRICEAARRLPANASNFRIDMGLRDELLVTMLCELAVSIGELLKADVTDLDLEENTISIRYPVGKAISRIKSGRKDHFRTMRDRRPIHLTSYIRDLSIRYLQGRREGPLVKNSRGTRLSVRQAERIVDKCARSAGIQEVVGHTIDGREIHRVTCRRLKRRGGRSTPLVTDWKGWDAKE